MGNNQSGFYNLPEGCIADVISLTTPRKACQLSLVSKLFRSAAESDTVWEKFLPSDYRKIIESSINPSSFPSFSSTKDLFLHLSDHPLIFDGGHKSFSLEKSSGKKCYMLAARNLNIMWGDTPYYWTWTSVPNSRFEEVAELLHVCWLEIHGSISTSLLSPDTNHAAYLVYKLTDHAYGFDFDSTRDYNIGRPAEVSVGMIGKESEPRFAILEPEISGKAREADIIYPKKRKDGWLEVELGEYFNKSSEEKEEEEEEDAELKMSSMEVKAGNSKRGLIVQGIEIRPKEEEEERRSKNACKEVLFQQFSAILNPMPWYISKGQC